MIVTLDLNEKRVNVHTHTDTDAIEAHWLHPTNPSEEGCAVLRMYSPDGQKIRMFLRIDSVAKIIAALTAAKAEAEEA